MTDTPATAAADLIDRMALRKLVKDPASRYRLAALERAAAGDET